VSTDATEAMLAELRALRRAAERRLHRDDVVSVTRAAKALPWRGSDAARWLRAEGLICEVDGREVVVWGRVLDHLDGRPTPSHAPRGIPQVGW